MLKNKYFFIITIFAIIIFTQSSYAQEKGLVTQGEAQGITEPTDMGFVYDSHDKRDPFVTLVSPDGRIIEFAVPKQKAGSIELEGIMYDAKGFSYAVVNSEVYKAGDSIGESVIVRIEPQKVVFTKAGKVFEVELKKEE